MAIPKILLVDDDVNITEILKTRFNAIGYEVFVAHDGEEALAKMKAHKPDVVVTDVSMPKMDGYALLREMKSDQDLKNIPTIVLTGRDSMRDIFEMEGVNTYLVKPYDFQTLLEKIQKLL